jgi:hypothetical protein
VKWKVFVACSARISGYRNVRPKSVRFSLCNAAWMGRVQAGCFRYREWEQDNGLADRTSFKPRSTVTSRDFELFGYGGGKRRDGHAPTFVLRLTERTRRNADDRRRGPNGCF